MFIAFIPKYPDVVKSDYVLHFEHLLIEAEVNNYQDALDRKFARYFKPGQALIPFLHEILAKYPLTKDVQTSPWKASPAYPDRFAWSRFELKNRLIKIEDLVDIANKFHAILWEVKEDHNFQGFAKVYKL